MDHINNNESFKLPRLYTKEALTLQTLIPLEPGQAHYLYNVLRRKNGDEVRLFNGKDGEWLGNLEDLGKKSGVVRLSLQLLPQPAKNRAIHLLFAPVKKSRMDWLIEKAVELGTTDFHPVITQNTEVRKLNEERLTQQIFEAAEQCERFEIPALHPSQNLETILKTWPQDIPLLACLERYNAPLIHKAGTDNKKAVAFLIGPEGGFTMEEKNIISKQAIAVSLGETILRSETAVVKALVLLTA